MRTNRRYATLLAAASLLIQDSAISQTTAPSNAELCAPKGGVVVPFFNGVKTTYADAQTALIYMRRSFGATSPTGEKISYESLYNWSNGFEDFLETFGQRAKEENLDFSNRYEFFWETLNGGGPLTAALTKAIPGYEKTASKLYESVKAAANLSVRALAENLPTIDNYVEQRERLNNYLLEGKKVLMFAHSQGNLFANVAFDYLSPKATQGAVKVVHVAPASPTLRGPWTLADQDVVINGLRLVGTVPANTDVIPNFLARLPGINNKTDVLGHGLAEIYLNQDLPDSGTDGEGRKFTKPFTRIKTDVANALGTLAEPPQQHATTGLFTVTLTWDGPGDVDLHVTEPGGEHIYYAYAFGKGGTLDKYTTSAYGPEHYYATCTPGNVVLGEYKVGVNNFFAATGRTATVQISTVDHGVLLTKRLDVGPERSIYGNDSPIPAATVILEKDATTGKYFVTAK